MQLKRPVPPTANVSAVVIAGTALRVGTFDQVSESTAQPLAVAAVAGLLIVGAIALSLLLLSRLSLYERQARRRMEQLHALHEAGLSLTAELARETVLQKVVDLSRRLASARYGALGILDDAGHIHSLITSGLSQEERAQMGPPPSGAGLLGAVLKEGRPIRVPVIQEDPRSVGFPPNHPPMTSFLGVPVVFKGHTLGNLYLANKQGAPEFSQEDQALLTMFATQAAIAIENARLYEQIQTLAVTAERERIAREMHDSLAQVLAYASAKTQAAQEYLRSGDQPAAMLQLNQLEQVTRDVYADVREAILGLRTTIGKGRALLPVLEEYLQRFTELTGIQTELLVTPPGHIFTFDAGTELQLMRIVQEALTNVRKHSEAERAAVRFLVDGAWAVVAIVDDGRGFDLDRPRQGSWPRFGLQVMRERAEAVGGSLEIESSPGQGTRIAAHIPVQSSTSTPHA